MLQFANSLIVHSKELVTRVYMGSATSDDGTSSCLILPLFDPSGWAHTGVQYTIWSNLAAPILHCLALDANRLWLWCDWNLQGEVFAAEGYAKVTGDVGVCIATSGPGATNLVTGLADALLDSVPMVAITGQVCAPSLSVVSLIFFGH